MAEKTEGDIEIEATPEEIMEVLTDYEAYPRWAQGIKKTAVRKKDSRGRGKEVYMEASSMGVGARYTLTYTYRAGNGGMSWTSKEASGAVKEIDGEYALEPVDDQKTRVTYRTTMELAIKVPGIMKRQAERQIIGTALQGLKKRVESGSR